MAGGSAFHFKRRQICRAEAVDCIMAGANGEAIYVDYMAKFFLGTRKRNACRRGQATQASLPFEACR